MTVMLYGSLPKVPVLRSLHVLHAYTRCAQFVLLPSVFICMRSFGQLTAIDHFVFLVVFPPFGQSSLFHFVQCVIPVKIQ